VKRQSKTVVSLIVRMFKHEADAHTLRTSAIALPYQPWLIAEAARPKSILVRYMGSKGPFTADP
jgi:hypothetical protein